MSVFKRDDVEIYYEEQGEDFPVLMIAPGGMRSTINFWEVAPWNPIEQLAEHYHVVAMDQRNAGNSKAPLMASDGWHVYTEDQLALMDHLGIDKFHVVGMCIGGPYITGLVEAAAERVVSAVLFQPIGLDNNREAFYQMFDDWAEGLKAGEYGHVSDDTWASFRSNMYDGDFLFNPKTDRNFIARCKTPMLVYRGNDLYHPDCIAREVVELAPNATLIENWKEPEYNEAAKQMLLDFLAASTPG
jgi:pimeloyl-ACP methyl ester carboxylesterase